MSHHELDLYGAGVNWKKALSILAVVATIVAALGVFGHRWLTALTPVSRDQALQMFKEETNAAGGGTQARRPAGTPRRAGGSSGKKDSGGDNNGPARANDNSGSGGGGSSPKHGKTAVAAGTGSEDETSTDRRSTRKAYRHPTTPKEGVYSWDTDGWEEAAGIRRDFPRESQRIITASNGSSWKQHHYFSEEREIWSDFVISKRGAHMAMQRNRAKFGPVTNDSTIDFSPPMLVGLADPEVGAAWSGKWRGRTSGTYAARIFEHRKMSIGGTPVEVWGYELRLQMKGELEGTVLAKVRYAPKYALTVQEHYTQDIQSERGRYRAEWMMTLKSTTPQR